MKKGDRYMNNQFDRVKYDFILRILVILEKHGLIIMPGKKYPEPWPLRAIPGKDQSESSKIEKLANDLGEASTDLLKKIQVPFPTNFIQKRQTASGPDKKVGLPECFGLAYRDADRKCQICGFEYDCENRPLEVLPSKNKDDTSQIAKLTDELGIIFNDLLAEVEQPLLQYFDQKRLNASYNHARLSVPHCFGQEHSDDRRCQVCSLEFDCERTIFN